MPGLIGALGSVGRTWALHHPEHVLGPEPWPADWPHPPQEHWALTELDPDATTATPVPGVVRDLDVTDDGTAWVLAAGVRRCGGDGVPAALLDVAALLDAQPRPTWGWLAD